MGSVTGILFSLGVASGGFETDDMDEFVEVVRPDDLTTIVHVVFHLNWTAPCPGWTWILMEFVFGVERCSPIPKTSKPTSSASCKEWERYNREGSGSHLSARQGQPQRSYQSRSRLHVLLRALLREVEQTSFL